MILEVTLDEGTVIGEEVDIASLVDSISKMQPLMKQYSCS